MSQYKIFVSSETTYSETVVKHILYKIIWFLGNVDFMQSDFSKPVNLNREKIRKAGNFCRGATFEISY